MVNAIIYRTKLSITHWKNLLTDPKPKLLLLGYHRVIPEIRFNPFNTIISLKTFIKQVDILAKNYPIISLNDAIAQCRIGKARSEVQVVLTFDDGYKDNYEVVFPILKQKGLPATFFLITDYIGSNTPLWDWEIFTLLYNDNTIDRVKIGDKLMCKKMKESALSFIFRIFDSMKSISTEGRKVIIDTLKKQIRNNSILDYTEDGLMIWEEVIKMSQEGMEIGAHSMSHCSLARIPFTEAMDEIKKSKEIIENNIKKPCLHFAFPFGSAKDYNQALINYVKNIGFQACLLNIHGYNHIEKDKFCFKRIIMDEYINLRYLLG